MGDAFITRRGAAGGSSIENGKIVKGFAYEQSVQPNNFVEEVKGKPVTNIVPHTKTLSSTKSFQGVLVKEIDENTVLYVYAPVDSNYPFVKVVKNTSNGIIQGTAVQLSTKSSPSYLFFQHHFLKLSDGRILAVTGDYYSMEFRIISISGTSITLGEVKTFEKTSISSITPEYIPASRLRLIELENNKVFVSHNFQYGSDCVPQLGGFILDINSDNSITQNTEKYISTASNSSTHEIMKLSNTKLLVVCVTNSSANQMGAYIVNIDTSYTTFDVTAETKLISSLNYCSQYFTLTKVSETEDIFMLTHSNATYLLYAMQIRVDGNTVTKGTDVQLVTTVPYTSTPNPSAIDVIEVGDNLYLFYMYVNTSYGILVNCIEYITSGFFTSYQTSFFNHSVYQYKVNNYTPTVNSFKMPIIKLNSNDCFSFFSWSTTSSNPTGYYGFIITHIDFENKTITFEKRELTAEPVYPPSYSLSVIKVNEEKIVIGFLKRVTYTSNNYEYDYYVSFLTYEQLVSSFYQNSLQNKKIDGVSKGLLTTNTKASVQVVSD